MKLRNNKLGGSAIARLMGAGALALLCNGAAAAEDDTIATDRPDFVESSNVVGKGRFQLETSMALERNRDAGVRARAWSTPTLLRAGIGEHTELRIETDGRVRSRMDGQPDSSGNSDVSLGIKWHLADAVANAPSMGLLVHADLPSGSTALRGEGVRPSARLVAEWELPDDFSLGVMPGLSYESNEQGKRYVNGILGVVVGRALSERLRGFVEIAAPQLARRRDGGTVATFNTGLAYLITPLCQIDTALSRGLNARTPDLSWTVGLSFKL